MLNLLILCSAVLIAGLEAQIIVKQLVEGQLQPTQPGTFKFVASVTLVRTPGMNMIVDTTAPTDITSRNLIVQRLSSLSLNAQLINVLALTHGHADHAGGAMLFPNAKLVTDFFEISGDQFVANELRQADAMELLPSIELWKVPGHTPEDIAVIVRNAVGLGTVAIAGDVFYTSAEGLADTPVWTQTALDAVRGKLSQQKVLCNVDYIVPGHGAMFAYVSLRTLDVSLRKSQHL
ncbi:Protein C03F11.2 [Aphelenchoides avenae]|nr:Protein C03F11.2 [Aphelenchus avenae]